MLIHTIKKALTQGSVSLTRHRIDLISRLVCALIQVRSVNMKKLACSLSGRAQIDRHYRHLQRFFSSAVSPSVFTQLIVSKVVRPDQPQLLVMDRTHWRLGRTDLNVLCVGLVYQGVSIPLAYQSLQKPGNSNTSERKRLLTKVLAYLDPRVCCVVPFRERDADLAEERRLFYVGMTRAEEELVLLRAHSRQRYGERVPCALSPFVGEIPARLLVREDVAMPRRRGAEQLSLF